MSTHEYSLSLHIPVTFWNDVGLLPQEPIFGSIIKTARISSCEIQT